MADEFIFFGTKSEQQALDKMKKEESSSQKTERRKEADEDDKSNKKIMKISYETSTRVDDATLTMLRRTRHMNDETTVYMQSDIQFYDSFYLHEDNMIDDEDLLNAARSIRRVYKNYPEYLYASYIRDLYLDAVKEKIGSEEMFSILMRSGGLNCWIPPIPIYSKRAEDYDDGINGIIDTSCLYEWDDDALSELIIQMSKDLGFIGDGSDVEVGGYLVTDNLTISHSDLINEYSDKPARENKSVNLSDMEELQKIFRGWYQDDSESSGSASQSVTDKAFSRTPNKLIEEYCMSHILDMKKEFRNAIDGVPNEQDQLSPNEMVFDEVLNRPMSRKEHQLRETIRLLERSGWGDTLRLMKLAGVGSSREYSILDRKNKKKKKSSKKIKSYEYDDDTGIYGDVGIPKASIFSDLDSLKAQMFSDD